MSQKRCFPLDFLLIKPIVDGFNNFSVVVPNRFLCFVGVDFTQPHGGLGDCFLSKQFFACFGIAQGVDFELDVLKAKHLEGIDRHADAFGIKIWAIFSNAFYASLDELAVST